VTGPSRKRTSLHRLLLPFLLIPLLGSAEQLTGQWEGTISSKGRLTGFQALFGTTSSIEILGRRLPLEAVRLDGDRVEFRISGPNPARFEGTLAKDRVTGFLYEGDAKLAFEMEREPDLPRPESREQAWQQDLDYAARKLLKLDRSFAPASAERFRQAIGRLRSAAGHKDDPHIIVELARAVALAGNAHTRLYLLRNRTELRRYPIRVWWFKGSPGGDAARSPGGDPTRKDGLYVVRATADHARLLSCRVAGIGGHAPRAVRARVAPLFAGNVSWVDYMSVYSMTSPEVLYGLDLVPDMEQARWSFECPGGAVTATLKPLPLVKSTAPVEAWWDLAPPMPGKNDEFQGIPAGEPPLYLRHPERHYLLDYLPGAQLLYFRFNRAANMPAGETMKEFGARLLAALRDNPVRKLVIDLRFNTGGDGGVGRALMEDLQRAASDRCVYVLTGRATFSAGLFHAAQWKQWGRAFILGEPVGDELDFWSEGGNIRLPNSGLTVHYANGFHSYSPREYPDRKPYFSDMSVTSLQPDVPIATSFEDYRQGRDPLLDAVLKQQCPARP